jgi:hypothetical protein
MSARRLRLPAAYLRAAAAFWGWLAGLWAMIVVTLLCVIHRVWIPLGVTAALGVACLVMAWQARVRLRDRWLRPGRPGG